MIKYLQQYIDDPWTLRLIRKFLTSGVLDHGLFAKSEKGTPQGSKTLSYSLTNRKLEQLGLMNMSKTLQSIQCD
ncbi:hypothetical protein HHK02_12465 [Limosilactobacillus reuteri]|uniref:Uncharacterized protein n=1 Tax=Limosilactobacillus reuteri TaxID=1598 RepID=A0A7L6BHS2_LIMRT|nr:hypothetical protein [Limosilactobacillus reuteri]QLQ61757.1 hypothetical protein HHK02_12465 [Limosilactobacillus reuteri]